MAPKSALRALVWSPANVQCSQARSSREALPARLRPRVVNKCPFRGGFSVTFFTFLCFRWRPHLNGPQCGTEVPPRVPECRRAALCLVGMAHVTGASSGLGLGSPEQEQTTGRCVICGGNATTRAHGSLVHDLLIQGPTDCTNKTVLNFKN